jgi:hypothetical protein
MHAFVLRNGLPGSITREYWTAEIASLPITSPPFHRKWCLSYYKTRLVINFLYFVIFLTTSQISFRFHDLPGLSLHEPSCSLGNQVDFWNYKASVNEHANSINQLIIDYAFYFRTILSDIKQVSYYSETKAAEIIRGARPGKSFLGLGGAWHYSYARPK